MFSTLALDRVGTCYRQLLKLGKREIDANEINSVGLNMDDQSRVEHIPRSSMIVCEVALESGNKVLHVRSSVMVKNSLNIDLVLIVQKVSSKSGSSSIESETSSAERITLRRGKDVAVPLYVFDKKRRYSLHLRPCIAVGDSPKFESCKLPLKEGIKKIETESFRKSRTSSLSDNYSTFIKKMQFNGTSGVDNYYFRICGSLSQFSNANNENQFEDRGNKTLFPKEISFVLLPALQIENIFPCPIVFSMIGTAEEEMLNKKILLNPGEIFDVVHTDVPARRTNSSLPGDITFYIPSLNATADNFADAFNDNYGVDFLNEDDVRST